MAKEQKGKSNRKASPMKFKDLRKILEEHGYYLERRANTTHAKFTNTENEHSVVVSGYEGGRCQGEVRLPIVQKTLKACNIKL